MKMITRKWNHIINGKVMVLIIPQNNLGLIKGAKLNCCKASEQEDPDPQAYDEDQADFMLRKFES